MKLGLASVEVANLFSPGIFFQPKKHLLTVSFRHVAARGRPPPVPASDQGTGRVVFLTVERPGELFART